MNKYRVELAAPAVSIYEYLSAHSGAKQSTESELLKWLDEIVDDALTFKPFDSGKELGGCLAGVHWISRGTLHIFYEKSPKPRTVVILSIWDGPNSEAHVRQADILCAQMLQSGKFQEMLTHRAAAN
jgi:hypothetical protein